MKQNLEQHPIHRVDFSSEMMSWGRLHFIERRKELIYRSHTVNGVFKSMGSLAMVAAIGCGERFTELAALWSIH